MTVPPGDNEPVSFTERYVVPADGRRRIAWASVRFTVLHSRAQRAFYVSIIAFSVLFQSLEGWDPLDRTALRALGLAVVLVAASVLYAATVGFAQTYRSTRHRHYPGAVLESGFGDDVVVLRGPSGESRFPRSALRRARVVGDFVVVGPGGLAGHVVLPRALFPDEQVARLTAP
jgi:hypothetical protein